jgi:hypothetical protein
MVLYRELDSASFCRLWNSLKINSRLVNTVTLYPSSTVLRETRRFGLFSTVGTVVSISFSTRSWRPITAIRVAFSRCTVALETRWINRVHGYLTYLKILPDKVCTKSNVSLGSDRCGPFQKSLLCTVPGLLDLWRNWLLQSFPRSQTHWKSLGD